MARPGIDKPRNRRWLWVTLGVTAAVVVAVGALILFVFGLVKSSDAYTRSLHTVQNDPQLRARIGTPIEPSFFVTGSISDSGDTGHAQLFYDVTGPRGTAAIYVVAQRRHSQWLFVELIAEVKDTGEQLDLHPGGRAPAVKNF